MIQVTDRLYLNDSEIEERFIRSPGPGGQNVNKLESAVQLRFDVRKARHCRQPSKRGSSVWPGGA